MIQKPSSLLSALLGLAVLLMSIPFSVQAREGGGLILITPQNNQTQFQPLKTKGVPSASQKSKILWERKANETLPVPKLKRLPNQVDANTFVISGTTLPGAEITAIGGPYELPAIYADEQGRFSIEVALEQEAVNQYLIKVAKDGEFAPAVTLYIVESGEAQSTEEKRATTRQRLEERKKTVVQKKEVETIKEVSPEPYSPQPDSSSSEKSPLLFKDVPGDAWFHDAIKTLKERDVISGYADGNFGPGDPVTRGQLMKMAVKATGIELQEKPISLFKDLKNDHPLAPYISTAQERNWVSGYADGRFGVDDLVTRDQAAKILVNAFGLHKMTPDTPTFPDISTDAWFYPYVETLAHHGVLQGKADGRYHSRDSLNRAEVAKMLTKLIELNEAKIAGEPDCDCDDQIISLTPPPPAEPFTAKCGEIKTGTIRLSKTLEILPSFEKQEERFKQCGKKQQGVWYFLDYTVISECSSFNWKCRCSLSVKVVEVETGRIKAAAFKQDENASCDNLDKLFDESVGELEGEMGDELKPEDSKWQCE